MSNLERSIIFRQIYNKSSIYNTKCKWDMLLIQFMVWSFYGNEKLCAKYVEFGSALRCLDIHTWDFSLMWNKLCQMVIFNMHKIWTIHLQCRNLANSLWYNAENHNKFSTKIFFSTSSYGHLKYSIHNDPFVLKKIHYNFITLFW